MGKSEKAIHPRSRKAENLHKKLLKTQKKISKEGAKKHKKNKLIIKRCNFLFKMIKDNPKESYSQEEVKK
jgi:hypothetical protein